MKEANLLNSELIVCPIKVSDARTTIAKSPSKKAYSVNEAPSVPIFYAQGGGTMQATALAISDFWPREIAFLASL